MGEGEFLDDDLAGGQRGRPVLPERDAQRLRLVEVAHDGAEGLEKLQTENFDLVLLDVMMPKMSGFEVCRALRRDHDAHRLPVLFVTAKDGPMDVIKGIQAGARSYITKPFTATLVMQLVEEGRATQAPAPRGVLAPLCSTTSRLPP